MAISSIPAVYQSISAVATKGTGVLVATDLRGAVPVLNPLRGGHH